MIGAAAFGAAYGAPGWHNFPFICGASFVLGVLLRRLAADAGLIIAIVLLPLTPAVISKLHGAYYWPFHVVWTAWVLGSFVARSEVVRWHVPARWRAPLAFWALIIATTWPIIAARECDFNFALLYAEHIGNSGVGGLPWYEATWVANVALAVGVTLLWFDWYFEAFARDDARQFRARVLIPFGTGIAIASVVALYQGLVDIRWLSGGQWPSARRAPGTLMDGDAFGALMGWWTTAFAAIALSQQVSNRLRIIAATGFFLGWGALWASGSRMALAGGVIGLLFVVPAVIRIVRVARPKYRMAMLASLAAVSAVLIVVANRVTLTTESPISRVLIALPQPTLAGVRSFAAHQFWNRGAPYGSASVRMLTESPLVGVGQGAFHILFPDYAYLLVRERSAPDNAQSWYRHQLAELGILGSLGWIVWLLSFGRLLLRARPRTGMETEAGIVRGAILAVGLVSAVSMPTQNVAAAFAVMVLTFWYLRLVDTSSLDRPMLPRVSDRTLWRVMCATAAVHIVLTLYIGWSDLRPPMRAVRADWPYAYGLYNPEVIDGRSARWTRQSAVAAIEAPTQWLQLVFWANHRDIATRPVAVSIWCDSKRIVRTRLTSGVPETVYWHVPQATKRVMLETSVDHVVRPRDQGLPDDRELGLALAWNFVDAPPPGASIAE